MKIIPEAMKAYLETHPFDTGDDDCATVLEQLYLAYANAHESDPPEIRKGFEELEELLHKLPCVITTLYATSAAAFAENTNIKPSLMACSTERIL